MNDVVGSEIRNGNVGRMDDLAHEIFEFREICAKARCIAMDKATKLFGANEESEVEKALSGGGLVGDLSTSIASAKNDILKVMEFVDSL
jgi:hypothetical protein